MSQRQKSSIILHMTKLIQEIELETDKNRLARIEEIKKKRRQPKKEDKKKKQEKTKKTGAKISDIDLHRIEWQNFCDRLGISESSLENGLSTEEAEQRHKEQGDNTLSQKDKDPWYMKLFHELTSFFALLLWGGSILCFIAYALDSEDQSNLYLGIVLAFVVSVTGIVTFFQNAKSDSIMEGFKNFIPQMCTVIRDGSEQSIPAIKLVTGDLIEVKEGERIPADIRIIVSNEMKVDNSSLTGESDALLRSEKCDNPDKILETKNVAFFGTLCKYGKGRGMVFNIGDDTIIGQIANLADEAEAGKTPLRRELDRFILLITCIALSLGVFFFCAGFVLRYKFIQNLVFAIGIIVANVPEGLLATITIALSVAATKLSYKKVLVKNLESVETLGSTSCICSDKTGTLTQNRMTAEHLWYNLNITKADSLEKKGVNFDYQYEVDDPHFQALHRCAILNSTAVFSDSMPEKEINRLDAIKKKNPAKYENELAKAKQKWIENLKDMPYYDRTVIGDASETALVKFFQPLKDIKEMRNQHTTAVQFDDSPAIVPFNSSYKYALHIKEVTDEEDISFDVYIKGAPERMWKRSTRVFRDGESVEIDDDIQREFEKANRVFAKNGERVLGFARYRLKVDDYPRDYRFNLKDPHNLPFPNEFEFLGLISLMDPPREAVPDAIKKCKTAGIKVIMVTGDQQLTAASIAKQIGIFEDKSSMDIFEEEEGITYEQAIERAEAIVINGDMLTKVAIEDEGLPENEKGKKLEKWLKKPQIVFARTSPAQKLYIVRGCQRLGYTVAVTGDGVNDSPAIKQADIGIAMGITGSDVAKDSADMILLNDDFSAIILGIEEGRKIFDNLKKSIAYTLTSNIPEIVPFLFFIIFAMPLPLSTVLILCVDLGTDIFPAVSFAYEDSELDIMTRLPRAPHQHLVTKKLLTYSYLQMGVIQTCGGFMCYFIVMEEFGFKPQSLFYLIPKPYLRHNAGDVYDVTAPFYGNTNVECSGGKLSVINTYGKTELDNDTLAGTVLDWLFLNDRHQDLRMGYIEPEGDCSATGTVKPSIEFNTCEVFQVSPISGRPVCFSTEALKYAQTSFFFSICFTQFSNNLSTKTRKLSLSYQGLGNAFMIMGWAIEFCLCIFLAYARPLNAVLGTRDVIFMHFAVYSFFFSILMLLYDETRKFLIRNFPKPEDKPNWFERNTLY